MSTVAEPIIVEAPGKADLTAVIRDSGLQPEVAQNLQVSFAPMFSGARDIISKSKAIVVTDVGQKLETKLACEYRKALKNLRIDADKTRKLLKEDSLRRGKAIDGFYNILLDIIAPEETRLEEQEKFVERKEQERKAALKIEREKALAPYGIDTTFYSLGEMPDESWAQLLENTRVSHEAKLAAARKAEEERIRLENERLKEEARIREENERLKKEAAEKEEAARIERERHAAAEADAAAKAIAELKRVEAAQKAQEEKALIEQDRIRAEAETARKAAEEAANKETQRLKAIAEAEQKKAETARLAAEAEATKQREAREKLEAEALAAKAAAEKHAEEQAEAARQASLAPDRQKLQKISAHLRTLELPEVSSAEAVIVRNEISMRLGKLALWIEKEATVL